MSIMQIRSTVAYGKAKKIWHRTVPAAVTSAALVLDQATKHIVNQEMSLGQRIPVAPLFQLHHVKNTESPSWSLILLGLSAALYIYKKAVTVQDKVLAGLFIAGATGNLIDRLVNNEVTDFIHFSFFPKIFNLADAYIGVPMAWLGLLVIYSLAKDELASK